MTTATTTRKSTKAKPKAEPTVTLAADLSPAVAAIEKAYKMFQRKFPDAPDVTIVVKRDEKAWGHTTVAKVWAPSKSKDAPATRFELMISGENLRRGAEAVAATLLHEAAHARNLSKGIMDVDSNGRHNLKFKATAEEHGLCIEQDRWHGWTLTSWKDGGVKEWAPLIRCIQRGLDKAAAVAPASLDHMGVKPVEGVEGVGGAGGPGVPGTPGGLAIPPKRGNRNLTKASCPCGHSIRASKGVLDKAKPTCSECGEQFAPAV